MCFLQTALLHKPRNVFTLFTLLFLEIFCLRLAVSEIQILHRSLYSFLGVSRVSTPAVLSFIFLSFILYLHSTIVVCLHYIDGRTTKPFARQGPQDI